MQKGFDKRIKIIIVIAMAALFVWFLILSPMIQFHNNEKMFEDAARRYYELNSDQLPTGERVKTLSLSTLYKKSYLKEDFHVPYSSKLCSISDSWVKVRKENNNYRYYVYLDCGFLTSHIDHRGPQIRLVGKDEVTVNLGEKFKDPGVSSVVDDTDGKMDLSEVTIKSDVDVDRAGTYEITYTAFDSFKNKSVVTRKVNVVKVLSGLVKNDLHGKDNYTGDPTNNYVRLSNMDFRIYGIDNNENVVLVADEDVANVNFTKIETWLDEVYLKHFTNEAKSLLVESEFCNSSIGTNKTDTIQCDSYTKKRYAYVPSIIDINKVFEDNKNFMKPHTISWTGNKRNSREAYVTRDMFYEDAYGQNYLSINSSYNYGVRPKIVVKGDTLVIGGIGTRENPYTFGETTKAKGGSNLNTRYSGEYILISGVLWRIVDVEKDGTVKVVTVDTLGTLSDRPMTYTNPEEALLTYNPKDKENYAYYINNRSSKFIDTSFFVAKDIEVPIYKDKIVYGEEKKTVTYKVKISPPNMYDMFSAQEFSRTNHSHSYWLLNSTSSTNRYCGVITDIGVPLNESIGQYDAYGVRAVAYIRKDAVISNGSGTYESPYKLK